MASLHTLNYHQSGRISDLGRQSQSRRHECSGRSGCRISSILAFIVIAMCAAGASAGTANTVTIADVTMQPGTVQDVPIRLLGSTGVGGVTVTLTFSQAIANVTSAVAGDFNIFFHDRSDVGNGILSVTCMKSGQDLPGDLVIATITLGAVGDSGSCKLGLQAELTDKSGVAVPSSVDNGTLTVGSAAITDNVTNDSASDGGDSPAASTPTAAPTSRSASTGTLAAATTTITTTATATTAAKTAAPVAIAAATTQAATTETTTAPAAGSDETMPEKPETTGLPGFEGTIAIVGLLAIGYVMMWQKR